MKKGSGPRLHLVEVGLLGGGLWERRMWRRFQARRTEAHAPEELGSLAA